MKALENDTIMGVFTHRDTYLPVLTESIEKFLPEIEFIVQKAPLPINANMEALRQKFIRSGKRFWIFLDDDIKFLQENTVRNALETMIRGRYALVTIYSTFDPNFVIKPEELFPNHISWVPGYFMLVDSTKIGHIKPDLDLPWPNTSIDTSYSVCVRAEGHLIGIAPSICYHQWKAVLFNEVEYNDTTVYLLNKWKGFYNFVCGHIDNIRGGAPIF